MVLDAIGSPLRECELPEPKPSPGQLLIDVATCGVCRTDLHVVDGDLPSPAAGLVPGHQIVGRVREVGESASGFSPGDRVGVPWLGGSCGRCGFCQSERENLCDRPRYTGYQIHGGFAERCVADADFCFRIPDDYDDLQAAPLLCAGLIGYRSLRMVGNSQHVGFYGFGAAAHILIQVARHQGREVSVFTRPGDVAAQSFARDLGAAWTGSSNQAPPHELEAAIIFAPVGDLVPRALQAVEKGGCVVCAGIHMTDIPSFPYSLLWGERRICSVANLTRRDGEEFFALAPQVPVRTEVHAYPLSDANQALEDLRHGRFTGAAVIQVSRD
jgi:propanol-preferring alcohol dehydrogenase